jgi:hypothetical protein
VHPARVQKKVTAERGADNSEDHIDAARMSVEELLLTDLTHEIADPPTNQANHQESDNFVHRNLYSGAAFWRF